MRQVKETRCEISRVNEIPQTQSEFTAWLNQQAAQHKLSAALAFADDGVIWGRFDGAWKWSGDASTVSSPFRMNTLQQLRLFGARAELFLWRVHGNWQGRLIVESGNETRDYFDEAQLLWGTKDGDEMNGFWLMREGKQGLLHSPPAHIANAGELMTRSYLEYDEEGCARILASRLVDAQEEIKR